MSKARDKSFLGTGWSFPPTFAKGYRGVKMTSSVEDIDLSLSILLSTRLGERVMQPDYGCNLDVLLFETINASLLTYVRDLVTRAIRRYEPRIKVDKVKISPDQQLEGQLLISVDYIIRTTNTRNNFVYPYYIKEGTNLKK